MTKQSTGRKTAARRWTAEHAGKVLTELSESGLSLAAFARDAGLDPQRLRAWRKRLGEGERTSIAPVFVEIPRRTIDPIEILLPSGVTLRVSEGVDVGALRRIADAFLGAVPC